ncbi:O-methyltransferase [Pusillimonas sp.]|uniref:O-methyltransferase n=1 Tax=Pusillimonas sp. TaxID=3040095 RepID=UPI0037CC25CA
MKTSDTVVGVARQGQPADVAEDWTPGTMAFELPPHIAQYLLTHSTSYGPAGEALVQATAALGEPAVMMIAPEQYGVLRLLAALARARQVLDLGTFTGLSAMALAEAVGEQGRVVTVDRNPAWIKMAETYWRMAGLQDRIEVRVGEVAAILDAMPANELYDMVFIDVDKAGIHEYVEVVLRHLTPHGFIVLDNVLWHGWVLDPDRGDADTAGMRRCSALLAARPDLEVTMLPVADGISVIRRKTPNRVG